MNDPIAPIVSQFEQDPNAIRIQKLLVYVCRNHWKSEISQFDAVSWRSLIEEAKISYPTIEELRSHLAYQIGTLNKAAEYTHIGQIILRFLERIYAQDAQTIVTALRTPKLEQDIHIDRIKKLLIYTCRKYWEANSYVIEQTSVSELIDELIKQYPSSEALRSGLSKVVKTLNKSVEYSLIAEIIVREVEPLYGESKLIETDVDLSEPINLFDIRREIVNSVNPLQAKILLFSSIYYLFEFCPQDWSNLKLHSLDGLLRSIVIQAETIEDLQQLLNSKARQLKHSETYLEIASVLVRSLKKNYDELRQNLQLSSRINSVADSTIAR